ncbi:MAG: succinate--CoA ligase subunit alpha [candidate division Zixibacteria bacterium CG_4_9_14_3_um_filter_46_8]|nr:MAG: succinate--CoA ligase subunit alpha [candidate division Zixibacteria bacterium CG_4_9_14_3_um_filter_46_8]
MAIYLTKKNKVIVQGITGRDGAFHTQQMIEYGTNIVGGVTPGKGGEIMHGVPVFESVENAVKATNADTSVIFVPPQYAVDAIYEAVDAGIKLVVCITEGVPVIDMLKVYHYVRTKGARLIGPNCPGIISPGLSKVGIMPGQIHKKGKVGVVSRSGTLTYEVVHALTNKGIGQSTVIGIGGDPIIGTNFIDTLQAYNEDKDTEAIVLIGEIGGTDEEEAARFIKKFVRKPVVAFIAGRTAPPGKRMGHAGAIISGGTGTAAEKVKALNAVGIPVADLPSQVADLIAEKLKSSGKRQMKISKKPTTKKAAVSKSVAKKKSAKKAAKK